MAKLFNAHIHYIIYKNLIRISAIQIEWNIVMKYYLSINILTGWNV